MISYLKISILKMTIHFITKNTNKFNYASSFLGKDFELIQLNEDTPEIQAENNATVAESSALWAANKFKFSVIKEDVGLYINALKGFPGPYLSFVENKIEVKGFLNLLSNIKDRSAFWNYSIAYCGPNSTPVSFTAIQHGIISEESRGVSGYFTDKIFIPNNESKTISQLLDSGEYTRKTEHYEALKEYLKKLII